MEPTIQSISGLADSIRAKAQSVSTRRFLLGITGYPGSGKSTLAKALNGQLNQDGDLAIVVPMDGFHLSNEELAKLELLHLKGVPASFDAAGYVSLLQDLRKEPPEITLCPEFDRTIEASIQGAIEVRPDHKIVITEGNYLLLNESPWNQIRSLLDEVWFVDTTFDTILPRLIERHLAGGKDLEGANLKVQSTDIPNAHLVECTRVQADRFVSIKIEDQ